MKYCRFQSDFGPQYGEIADRNGTLWIERLLPPPAEDPWIKIPSVASNREIAPNPLKLATVLPPVVPSKIVCIGRNYREHAAELGNEVPKEPLLFFKPPSSLVGSRQNVRRPKLSQRVDYEGELGVVIAQAGYKIGVDEDVRPYILGYTCVNELTARDLQNKDGQWTRAKGFDTFCPVGPLVTGEMDPWAGIGVKTTVNGDLRQDGNTRDFIFAL